MKTTLTLLSLAALLASQTARAQSPAPQQPEPPAASPAAPAAAAPGVAAPAQPVKSAPVPVVNKWAATLYGFAEFDAIYDTRESMTEVPGNPTLPRTGTYGANHARLQESMRNSRLGLRFSAPEYRGMKASGNIETDFFGNQPNAGGGGSEGGFYNNAGLRVRHAFLKLETPVVDLVAGQTWQLFGWQPYSHPNTVELQGVPGQVYSRTTQLRLSKTVKTDAVNVEVAAAAARPEQRDSATPDGQAGLRVMLNGWKGVRNGSGVDALALGVSGVVRRLQVNGAAGPPANTTSTVHGQGLSVDGFIPVIRGTVADRSNALTLTGSYVKGEAIQDMYSGYTNGGATTFQLASSNGLDAGVAGFDSTGKLTAVKVESAIVGAQYYLPVDAGNVWISVTASQATSDNAYKLFGATKSWKKERWLEAALFYDLTPAVRVAGSWGWFENTYGDDQKAHNDRYQLSAFFYF